MQSNNYTNSENKLIPFLNVIPNVTSQSFFNQNINHVQNQNNLSMITNNSNLQLNPSNSLNNLINSLNRSVYVQSNTISNYGNTLDTHNTINNVIPINNNINQNTFQQHPPNTTNFINNHEIKTNINQNQVNYSNLKLLLSSNQNQNLNTNSRKDSIKNTSFNQNINSNTKNTSCDPSTLHSLFCVPYFTFEMLNNVNVETPYSQERNGHDLPFSDITSLRFFFNLGIQHFKNVINKNQSTKNTTNDNSNLISLLSRNKFNEDQEVSINHIKPKLDINSLQQNIKSTDFQKTFENTNISAIFNNDNSSNNTYTNNLPLHNNSQSFINQKNIIDLLQQRQIHLQDNFNNSPNYNYPTQNQSVIPLQQKIIPQSMNLLESQQKVFNEPLNFDDISQKLNRIASQQNIPSSLNEKLNNTPIKSNHVNNKAANSSNETTFTLNILEKNTITNDLIKQEIIPNSNLNNTLQNIEVMNDNFSTMSSSIPELSNENNSINSLEIFTNKNKPIESNDLIKKNNQNLCYFTKQFPVCIIQRVSEIVDILNDKSENKKIIENNDEEATTSEEYKNTIDYQEKLLNIDENDKLKSKIYEDGEIEKLLDKLNYSLEGDTTNNDLLNNKISQQSKRRRESSIEAQQSTNNIHEIYESSPLQNDSIEKNKIKRFKKSNSENNELNSNFSNDKNFKELSNKSIISLINNTTPHIHSITSNYSNEDDMVTLSYHNGKYYISNEKNNQSTFVEVCNTNSEKENEDIEQIFTKHLVESNISKNKKVISLNINNFIVSPYIDNYIRYIKNEFLRQLTINNKNHPINYTSINLNTFQNNLPLSASKESNETKKKVAIYNTSNQNLQNHNFINHSKNMIRNIGEQNLSLDNVKNSSIVNFNIPQPETLPIKIPENFCNDNNLQSQLYSHISLQRTTELEELLKKDIPK